MDTHDRSLKCSGRIRVFRVRCPLVGKCLLECGFL